MAFSLPLPSSLLKLPNGMVRRTARAPPARVDSGLSPEQNDSQPQHMEKS